MSDTPPLTPVSALLAPLADLSIDLTPFLQWQRQQHADYARPSYSAHPAPAGLVCGAYGAGTALDDMWPGLRDQNDIDLRNSGASHPFAVGDIYFTRSAVSREALRYSRISTCPAHLSLYALPGTPPVIGLLGWSAHALHSAELELTLVPRSYINYQVSFPVSRFAALNLSLTDELLLLRDHARVAAASNDLRRVSEAKARAALSKH